MMRVSSIMPTRSQKAMYSKCMPLRIFPLALGYDLQWLMLYNADDTEY